MGASSWAFRVLLEELAPMGRSYGEAIFCRDTPAAAQHASA